MYAHDINRAAAGLLFEIGKQISDYADIVVSQSDIVDRYENDAASAGLVVYPYGARGHRIERALCGVVDLIACDIVGRLVHIVGHNIRLGKTYAEIIALGLADIIKRAFFKLGRGILLCPLCAAA